MMLELSASENAFKRAYVSKHLVRGLLIQSENMVKERGLWKNIGDIITNGTPLNNRYSSFLRRFASHRLEEEAFEEKWKPLGSF